MLDLASRAEEHAARESRLSLARRAVPVVGPLAAVARAETAEVESRAALERAREVATADAAAGLAWPVAASAAGAGGETVGAAGTLVEAGEDALRERASELSREIGEMAAAVTAEESLPALEAARASALEAVAQAESTRAATHTALAELPARQAELGEAKTAASAAAARAQDLGDTVERAQKAVAAHAELAEAAAALATATEEVARAAVAHQEAAAEHARLALGRLRSQAAHLAADLSPGEPCPVCGGTEHPSPAQPSDGHVTDAQVEAAFAQIAPREQRLAAARERHSELDRLLAAARERAGEGDAAAADAALVEARAAHAAAVEAAAERDRLAVELDALGARKTELTLALETQAEALEKAQARATETATELDGARTRASRHPEGFASASAYANALRSAKSLVETLAGATSAAEDAAATLARAREELAASLDAAGFTTADEAREAALDPRELATLAQEVDAYREARAKAEGVVAELSERELPDEPADLEALSHAAAESAQSRDAAIEAATGAAARLATLEQLRAEYEARGEESAAARAERDVVAVLADSLEGKAPNERRLRLESFVLASKLERIVAAANARLETMSSGQYRLEHDDQAQYRGKETGLALRIADSHTGQSRSTRSLSGGETFLASLALALGLAETVTAEAGGIELGTLFIDEGFGSLDGDTLEIAMSTLEDLRDSGRTVGLISHVEAMHDAIPARLEVEKAADGSSRVRTRVGQRADA
jgi:exonuclease SbcC